jgi:hypothetical protein
MNTNLNSAGYLPTQQPFNSSPLSYSGVEKVVSNFFTSHNDIVDWVLVELRTGTSSSTIVAERAGLLKSNGMIVGLDGVSPLRFGLPTDDYYMVIRHRNHLAIMSSIPVTMSNYPTINSYNFTDAQNKAYTLGPNPMADLGSGKYGMYTGDGNANGSITASDNNSIWLPQFLAGVDGYKSGDYNMNGSVTASDNNSAWLINFLLGANSQVP